MLISENIRNVENCVIVSNVCLDGPIKNTSINWELIFEYLRIIDDCINVLCVCQAAPVKNISIYWKLISKNLSNADNCVNESFVYCDAPIENIAITNGSSFLNNYVMLIIVPMCSVFVWMLQLN